MGEPIDKLDFSLSKAAHDMRTPLTAIQGYGELLLEDLELGLTEEAPNYLHNILALVVELEIMIGNLVDLERLKKRDATIEPRDEDLNTLIRDIVPRLERLTARNGMSLRLRLSDLPLFCRLDPYCTKQSIQNLVCCVLLRTPEGGQIEVCTRPEGEYAVVVVSGAGSDTTFNQSRQAGSAKEGVKHYGFEHDEGSAEVALYIARSFVEAQSGELVTERLPAGMSSFTVKLPV